MAKTTHDRPKGTPPRGEVVSAANADESTSNARADAPTAATWVHVSELRPNPKNPRLHGQEVLLLARTIVRTTWGAPILVQARTMRIIGGHGRLEAAKEILAGIEVDGFLRGGAGYQFRRDAPPECLPVCVLDVSDAEADAMTLADNAKRLQGKDDPSALVAMATASFERNAPTMLDMGLGADDLDALIKQAGDAVLAGAPAGDGNTERPDVIGDDARERIEVEEDEAPVDRAEELRAKWGTAAGQLWEIPSATVAGGVHRILCGDSTAPEDVARVMGGETAVLLHTDPPYGVDVVGGAHDPRDEKNYQSGGKVENDALSDEDLRALVRASLTNCRAHMVPGAAFYVWYGENRMPVILGALMDALGMYRQIVVWVKEHFVFGRKDYHYQHEACFYGWVEGAAHRWLGDRKQTSVWTTPPVGTDLEKKLHPTAKPLALPSRSIQNHVAPGEIVIEPFSGSGSTMVAAEKTGRLCRAVELAPKYVAVCLERLAALGLTPRLVS
mgnify:CR=1 FL=1